MIRPEPTDRFRGLLDVVASWPGITMEEAATEIGVSMSSIGTYVAGCRRLGWVRRGAVPRLVDIGDMVIADYRAADGMRMKRDRGIYQTVCSRYDLNLPCNIRDVAPHGWKYHQVNDAFVRLRQAGPFHPVKTLWPTELGNVLASARMGWDAPRIRHSA